MPISTSTFGDERDSRYSEYGSAENYESESMDFDRLSVENAETMLKRLGGGVAEKTTSSRESVGRPPSTRTRPA